MSGTLSLLKQLAAGGGVSDSSIRNFCIIAHVDHGKTTLSDFLLASNNHVSVRQIESGQKTGEAVRFLDSRLDEIDRQITIKSSCISLIHREHDQSYLMNLIDSPGHVDFSAEVIAAARLTDGAILVVDAVEGVRAQTYSVIRQAWSNRVVPILFINKIDRLVDLVPDCVEAYGRIRAIVETANMVFHDLLESDKEENDRSCISETDLAMYQFDPVKGNVLFGSALHGWAFDLTTWANRLVKPKLPETAKTDVAPYMFGEYTLSGGKIVALSAGNSHRNLFVKFVLDQVWQLYGADKRQKLVSLFPVANCVFGSVVRLVPGPRDALIARSEFLVGRDRSDRSDGSDENAIEAIRNTSSLVYVVKHLPADLRILSLLGDRVDDVRQLTGFVSLARVFAGTVSVGDLLFAEGDKKFQIKSIYLLLGASLVEIDSAVAGCVVGLVFSDSGMNLSPGTTLSTSSASRLVLVSPYDSVAQAIVQVTVEVRKSIDEPRLDRGLALLAHADPAVLVFRHPQTGERFVGCCGDEHLHRCVQDLQNLFAPGVDLTVSAPIVEIRETVDSEWRNSVDQSVTDQDDNSDELCKLPVWLSEWARSLGHTENNRSEFVSGNSIGLGVEPYNSGTEFKRGSSIGHGVSPDKLVAVTVRVEAVPSTLLAWIEAHKKECLLLFHEHRVGDSDSTKILSSVESRIEEMFEGVFSQKFGVTDVCDLYVKNDAINLLCSPTPLSSSMKFGFRQACASGPLSEEAVRGVVWSVVDLMKHGGISDDPSSTSSCSSSESFAMAHACRSALLAAPVRVCERILSLEIQTEEIKPAQTVLATRRAEIFYSDLVEGSYSEYLIKAWIPASEAFKGGERSKLSFSDELRTATHGKVVYRLAFSHWQTLSDSNPLVSGEVAHKLVTTVRKRKGLSVGEKVVVDADKQRTLTKMK